MHGAAPTPLVAQLGRALSVLKQAYADELGVSPLSVWILSLLSARDGLSQAELNATMRVDPSMITRTLKELETEHGWVRRERDPEDNRLVRVYLTNVGRDQASHLGSRAAAIQRRLTQGLDERQQRELREMLGAIEMAARRAGDAEAAPTPRREGEETGS
jgi:DNA-binding MarR family transcriptional regulator